MDSISLESAHGEPAWNVLQADCRELFKAMADCGLLASSIVCDPPYELSNSSKASPYRIAAEVMFPKHAQIETAFSGEDCFGILVRKILDLCCVGGVPHPSVAVPVGSMTFDGQSANTDHNIENAGVGAVLAAQPALCSNAESELSEYLGCFTLKLADFGEGSLFEAFDRVGAGFVSGGLGIGFRVSPTSAPSFCHGGTAVVGGDDVVRMRHTALADLVGALSRAESTPVARFHVASGTHETFSTVGALVFLLPFLLGGAQLVRATAATSSLPAMFETHRVRIVDNGTGRALHLDLLVHSMSLAQTGFMGKAWDGSKIAFDVDLWRQALAAVKPGGWLVAFGGTRTSHRLACAIEDAGWELRDTLMYLYGTGFPKSHNLPDGRGTALKPAWEPILLARAPFKGSVEKNAAAHGTGALNIDACRIGNDAVSTHSRGTNGAFPKRPGETSPETSGRVADQRVGLVVGVDRVGRWPANLILDEEAGALLGAEARFFYCSKASRAEREVGLDDLPASIVNDGRETSIDNPYQRGDTVRKCTHPTVKPVNLMRWLVKLITPANGLVLDPFMGSGTTGVASLLEGRTFLACDTVAEYVTIAHARMAHAAKLVVSSSNKGNGSWTQKILPHTNP